jgi:hypothetical protein
MRAFLPDPDLELPRPAGPVRPVPLPAAGLIRHGRASDRPIVLAGRRATVEAQALRGVGRITADGTPLTGPVHCTGPAAANVVSTPRSLIRECIGAGGGLRETVLVPERLPGAVIQWTASALMGRLTLDVQLPAVSMAGGGRYRAEGGMLRWSASPGPRGGVFQLCGVGDEAWVVVERDDGWWAQISFGLDPDSPATLLAAAVGDPDRLPSLPALAAVRAHRRRDELEPDDAAGLRLETGVPDLDEGVGWARAALRAGLEERGGASRLRWGSGPELASAALTAGEWEVARVALTHSGPSVSDAEARARWMAWTGKPRPLLEARSALEAVLAEASQPVRARVADAAEAAGDEEWAAALRTVVARAVGRRLPTVGAASRAPSTNDDVSAGDDRRWDGVAFDDRMPASPQTARAVIAALRSSDPEPAIAWLRSALSWMRRESSPADGAAAAATLQLLAEGLLGVDPDAAYGRLRLSPCLPESWNAFHVRGIRLGDAVVDMEMTREGETYRFALRQKAGGAPVTWIFAPRLPGVGVARVRVDGEEALVDSRPVGRRIEPRIQIPAERERIVEIELTPP